MNLKNLAGGLDPSETFYVVDGDYRTIAQGWSKADATGPLDLWQERNPGRVFYAGSGNSTAYATDAAAIQGAIDATVDFRGDKVLLLPGSYSIATALTLDSAGMRLMGQQRDNTRCGLVTVTAAVDAAYTVSVDDVEIAHHTMIPLTAKNFIDVSSGADRGYLHHLYWNAAGIATSTSTEFLAAAASADWLMERCSFYVDDEQGDVLTLTSSERWIVQDCDFTVGLTGVAWASVFTFATSALGNVIRRCMFRGAGGATPAVFTNIVTGVANVNGQLMFYGNYIDGTALATASGIETTFGTTLDIEVADNHQSGDASGEGGVLIALA